MSGPQWAMEVEREGSNDKGIEGIEEYCAAVDATGAETCLLEGRDPSECVLTTGVLGSALDVGTGDELEVGLGGALEAAAELAPAVPEGALLNAT